MGIFWVFFSDRGNQLKLRIDANGRKKAIKMAKQKAAEMNAAWGTHWQFKDCQACR